MTNEHVSSKSEEPRYRLGFRSGGLVLTDGPRQIEMGMTWREYKEKSLVEYTLFAMTIRRWEHPDRYESITDEVREHILTETKRLLEARDNRIQVVINRTELGGELW
jgi:hypothetical protein